jgi:hypothetical protein
MPRWPSIALTIASLPQPPSWHGVYSHQLCLFLSMKMQTYCRANLQVVLPDWTAIVHRIERRNFINAHRGHFQQSRHLIHHTQARESMLALSKIQQWHHGRLLVLWWVALQDLIDELVVLLSELKGNIRIVFWSITVLIKSIRS